MSTTSWLLFLLLAAGAAAFTVALYRRREPSVRGRGLLTALRAAVLALLLLLLFDPDLDLARGVGDAASRAVVVDRSLSMALPAGPDATETRWDAALDAARESGEGRFFLMETEPRPVPLDSLEGLGPADVGSRLSPALRAAVEGGARQVLVITDRAIEDAADVHRWLPATGARIDVRQVAGAALPDRWIAAVEAPAWAEAGEPFTLTATLAVSTAGASSDSALLRVVQGGREVARTPVALPEPGRSVDAALEITPSASAAGEMVRYDVALDAGDAIPDNDLRSVYVRVADEPAGVALVSFEPDWEPRFLLPALARATGLPTRGYLRMAGGRYARLGEPTEAAASVGEAVVRQAAAASDLVVLHGLSAESPGWARELATEAPRVVVFPGERLPPGLLPSELPSDGTGEWYVDPAVPPSPVAPLLEGIQADSLPPLSSLRPVPVRDGLWAPLAARRSRRGPPAPILVAGEIGGRRRAVALGKGYWRWAFRPGAPRAAYRQLWSSVAGWLMAGQATAAGEAVRPLDRSVSRGEPVVWSMAGVVADTLVVALQPDPAEAAPTGALPAPEAVPDSARLPVRGDTAVLGALPPGHYRYRVHALAEGEQVAASEGALTVERFTPELTRGAVELPEGSPVSAAGAAGIGRGRPLHTVPWIYLAVVGLLAAEWVLRRRWGLR